MPLLAVVLFIAALFAGTASADNSAAGTGAADTNAAAWAIEAMMATLHREGELTLDGEPVQAVIAVPPIYAAAGYAPLWIEPAAVTAMLAAIRDIAADGLDPADYHVAMLTALGTDRLSDPVVLARRDVLLTDALALMTYHLAFGRTDPERLDRDWNLHALYDHLDIPADRAADRFTQLLLAAITDGNPGALLDRARPDLHFYGAMRDAHVRYRALAAAGGWPAVPAGSTLREGDADPRVAVLRRRLAATGDLAAAAGAADDDEGAAASFDAELADAVARFQRRHGLDADGIVGPHTIAALNVPANERAQQLRVNLERDRWAMNLRVDDLLLVNIAAFNLWMVRDGLVVWRDRVQVGAPFTATPVFSGSLTYLEFNPTWTVPASIANRTVLPALRKDPGYLERMGMRLLDREGREVPPVATDWDTVARIPYIVRQDPGPINALGRVKFMFPNKFSVYLHDTPARANFKLADRAFSAGCIRVEHPLELVALLLADQPAWTADRIDAILAAGKTTRARLAAPLPVLLLYWTAYVDPDDGTVQFRSDLYKRDAAVLAAMQQPMRLHRRNKDPERTP